jgi:glycosyltransferase involved in cell wall biosynthesis
MGELATMGNLAEVAAGSTEPRTDAIELSIVLPCLNEAETVQTCVGKAVRWLAENGVAGEVIVADNGSTDNSQELAIEAGARVVSVRWKGYGNALLHGIRAARGTYVLMADADDSYDLTNLGPFLEKLRQGDDLVMGNRFAGGSKTAPCPGCTAGSATRCCRSSAGSSTRRRFATSTAASARSARTRSTASVCARAAWSSPAR